MLGFAAAVGILSLAAMGFGKSFQMFVEGFERAMEINLFSLAAGFYALSGAIAAFAIGLPAFILSKIFMPIFYANQDAKTPMKITIYTIILNIILNIIFMHPLEHVGIALGTSIAAWYNVFLFVRYARMHGYFHLTREIMIVCAKIMLSCIISGFATLIIYDIFSTYLSQDHLLSEAISVLSSITLGFVIYVVATVLFGVLNMRVVRKLVKK